MQQIEQIPQWGYESSPVATTSNQISSELSLIEVLRVLSPDRLELLPQDILDEIMLCLTSKEQLLLTERQKLALGLPINAQTLFAERIEGTHIDPHHRMVESAEYWTSGKMMFDLAQKYKILLPWGPFEEWYRQFVSDTIGFSEADTPKMTSFLTVLAEKEIRGNLHLFPVFTEETEPESA